MGNTTYEFCPHCETEVEIPDDRPSACPNCGIEILPCSTCRDESNRLCDWTEENRCNKYPRKEQQQ